MTKQELVEKLEEVYNKIGEVQSAARALANELSDIELMIEDLPSESSEITDENTDQVPHGEKEQ